MCDTLAGSYIFTGVLFPAVFGTSSLDTRLNSDDPSGASPLRDRQAVAVGLGSVDRIVQRQGLSLLCFKAQMRHPCGTTKKDGTTLTRSPNLKNLFNEINASDKQNLYLTDGQSGAGLSWIYAFSYHSAEEVGEISASMGGASSKQQASRSAMGFADHTRSSLIRVSSVRGRASAYGDGWPRSSAAWRARGARRGH